MALPITIVAVLLATIVGRIASAQTSPLDDDDRRAVIERIGSMLEERYVFPDIATHCAVHLEGLLSDGAFDDATHAEDLSERLTQALRSVSRDKHILVRPRLEPPTPEVVSPEERARMRVRRADRDRERNFGFEKLERLDGNVGYLDLRYFAGDPESSATAAAAMAVLAHADALIIDLRHNSGGYPGMVRFLCSYLFDEPTHLNSLYWRDGDRTEEFWTLDDVPGTKIPDVPVFVLTSSSTFSGAEEFSYNLRTRDRATLVGETTRGGANPGGVFPVNERFEIIIPLGRAINPITGTNWEGTGVTPHIDVPAADALERALALARPAAEAHREAKAARWIAFEVARAAAYRLNDEGRPDEAARTLVAGVREAHASGALDEAAINICGYECLGASWTPSPTARPRPALAIAVLAFNVEMFPESANAHDSLGEAYRAAGDVDRAIANYERAIALQPDGPNADNARVILAELRETKAAKPVAASAPQPTMTRAQDVQSTFVEHEQLSPFVRRVLQDKRGHLWFGTNGDGVIRYDGESLAYFSINEGFGGVAVRGIVQDKQENIWFGTERGITRYDGTSFVNFTENDGLVNDDVWSIVIDSKGIIWIGTLQGVSRFDGKGFTAFPLPESDPDPTRGVTSARIVHCIMEDSKGRMWFATNGGAYVFDGTSLTNIKEKDGLCHDSVNCILEARDGSIWFATHHNGVCRFDGTSFTHFNAEHGVQGTEAWNLYEDKSGNIWFPIENSGVYRYDGKSFTRFQEEQGLTSNAIQCTFEDKEGRLWLGGWMGLFRCDGKSIVRVGKNGPWR